MIRVDPRNPWLVANVPCTSVADGGGFPSLTRARAGRTMRKYDPRVARNPRPAAAASRRDGVRPAPRLRHASQELHGLRVDARRRGARRRELRRRTTPQPQYAPARAARPPPPDAPPADLSRSARS